MEQATTTDVQVLDRMVAVLWAVEAGPRSLAELVVDTGLARATTHRLATALERHGLLARDDVGRWLLGPTLGRLGASAAGSSLLLAAAPVLEALRDITGESAQLYVRRGAERVCVASSESPHSLRTIVAVGAVLPLARGSAGRVLAGDAGGGWVESVEEREAGVASVSAPVVDRRLGGLGRVVAAVSVSGPVERTTRQPGERYGPAVSEAAARLERAAGLGFTVSSHIGGQAPTVGVDSDGVPTGGDSS
jgi:DNA-binding IclR family transcriptional regulator